MQTSVLLSIKPEFAEKIFSGLKRYEFRRVLFKSKFISKVVVYASSPVQRVIGEFEIEYILALDKRALWKQTKEFAGIEKAYFDDYFENRTTANAIKIKCPRRYSTPLRLGEVCDVKSPPQSFMYLQQKQPTLTPAGARIPSLSQPAFNAQVWKTHAEKYFHCL